MMADSILGRGGYALAVLALLVLANLAVWSAIDRRHSTEEDQARNAVVKTIGVTMLALTYECIAVRSPIEGLNGCLGEVAGGYCSHKGCELVVAPSTPSGKLQLEIYVAP